MCLPYIPNRWALTLITKLNITLHGAGTDYQHLPLTDSTSTPTMTGMALDSIQRTIWTTLTTSLAKKGSQKPSFLDVSPSVNHSNYPQHNPLSPATASIFDHSEDNMTLPAPASLSPPHNPTPHTRLYNHSAYIYTIDLITYNTWALHHALSIFQDQHAMILPVTSVVSNHNKQTQPTSFYHPPLDST